MVRHFQDGQTGLWLIKGLHMNNARLPNPSNVGGASGVENVKNMWLHHY